MPVNPSLPREVLVVHGVQTETDDDSHHDLLLRKLLDRRLNGVRVAYRTDLFRYEGLNDHAQGGLQKLMAAVGEALLKQVPLADMIMDGLEDAIDLVGDVVIALDQGSIAADVRERLCERIMHTYRTSGAPLYLVGHSLGSVYAFDAVNTLMETRPEGVFDRDRRRTWPVQGLITFGSPLGLPMFNEGRRLVPLGSGRKWFRWFNYWCRTDPVVSGSFYGRPQEGYRIAERFLRPDPNQGWIVHDRVVDSGSAWLLAHGSYWDHSPLGDDLITFISS